MGSYSMSTCDDGHEQVTFTSHKCPMCELLKEINELKDECNQLQTQIDEHVCGEIN